MFFAAVTRFEPSVLRAVAMAAIATTATFVARPASTLRVLALAVTALLLVDPLLVWSVGFGLSVGASLGIVLLARPLAARLRGPRVLIEPLAVTASMRRVINSGTEIAEIANTRKASTPPTIVPVTSRPSPWAVKSKVGRNSLAGGNGLLPWNSMRSRKATCTHTTYTNARMALCSARFGPVSIADFGKWSCRIRQTVDWLRPMESAMERVVQPRAGGSRSTHVKAR